MITAVYYDEATGRISRQLTVLNTEEVALNLALGESWIEGECDINMSRVVQGQIVERDSAEIESEEVARAWLELRSKRTELLNMCDWTQVSDAPVDQTQWAYYRQLLRELPEVTVDPRYPVWPTPPT